MHIKRVNRLYACGKGGGRFFPALVTGRRGTNLFLLDIETIRYDSADLRTHQFFCPMGDGHVSGSFAREIRRDMSDGPAASGKHWKQRPKNQRKNDARCEQQAEKTTPDEHFRKRSFRRALRVDRRFLIKVLYEWDSRSKGDCQAQDENDRHRPFWHGQRGQADAELSQGTP